VALPPLDDEWVPVSMLPLEMFPPPLPPEPNGFAPVEELLDAAVEEPCDELDCSVSFELLLACRMRTTRGREFRSRNSMAVSAPCKMHCLLVEVRVYLNNFECG